MDETVNDELDHLVGTWTLAGVTEYSSEGTSREPYGQQPNGQLIYTAEGFMAVVILAGGDAPAVNYAGEVSTDGIVVCHHVRVGAPPFTGDQVRFVRFDGSDRLVLASDQPGRPRIELRWVRSRAGRLTRAVAQSR
ncbi:lipocalin-like domain-containing protein [Streptomyces sp. NPDC021056]|uniref:lipocalin-like domain-containing protein n=1 Tax=Streptomyces TaxID=1883 RepID=UPI001E4108EB|nr:lipocalin-like domain-containing protein [Streptomyces lincolnensis]MCD7445622.1 lipocalin-like domain-containing protein [Streptomyces lincolnensis]